MRTLFVTALLLSLSAVPVGTEAPREADPQALGTGDAEEIEAPDEFVPSERVRADNEVSFPVDI